MFNKDVLPLLGCIPIDEVKKGHITEVTDALLARGVNRMAKMIFSLMRQMFRFAVDRDLIDHDPTAREPLIYSTKPGHSVSPRRLR